MCVDSCYELAGNENYCTWGARLMKRDAVKLLLQVLISIALIFVPLRLISWYINKPVVVFANMIFYVAIVLLIIGLTMVMIKFLINNNKNSGVSRILDYSKLLIIDGVIFLIFSSVLTMMICGLNS